MLTNFNSFNYLVCQVCSKYYLNPVILPCGNNICEEHVNQKLEKNNSKIYECDFCFIDHETPENGFIINRPFIEMMNDNKNCNDFSQKAKNMIEDISNLKKDIDAKI